MRNKRKETLDSNETSEGEGGGQTQMRSLTRHLSQAKPTYDHSETGFLWSWNFMISKKWKITSNTGATGEIPFMVVKKMSCEESKVFIYICRYQVGPIDLGYFSESPDFHTNFILN